MPSTAVIWGPERKHLQVGVRVNWPTIGPDTTTATPTTDWWVRSVAWGFDDDQTLVFGGSLSGSWNYHFPYKGSASSYSLYLGNLPFSTVATSYSGGPSWNIIGTVTGIYSGAGGGADPSVQYLFTLPPRPAAPPNIPPNLTHSDVRQNRATFSWGTPDTHGSPVTGYHLQVSPTSTFSTLVYNVTATTRTRVVANLLPNTRYYYRVRARSSAGDGNFSTARSLTTDPSAYVRVGGTWRPARAYVRVGGTWRTVEETYVHVGGNWRS